MKDPTMQRDERLGLDLRNLRRKKWTAHNRLKLKASWPLDEDQSDDYKTNFREQFALGNLEDLLSPKEGSTQKNEYLVK